MADVLIRDVPPEDLDEIKSAAAARGVSLQAYLREAVHEQAAHLRRRKALARTASRLVGRPAVADEDRAAVLAAVDAAHTDRAEQLSDRC